VAVPSASSLTYRSNCQDGTVREVGVVMDPMMRSDGGRHDLPAVTSKEVQRGDPLLKRRPAGTPA
jgi:hypothetical protein